MKKNYYLFKNGRLKRQENTLVVETDDGTKHLPVKRIHSLHSFGQIDLNTRLTDFLAEHHIALHFYGYFGNYKGSFYPKEHLLSGDITVQQVRFYDDKVKRQELAARIVRASIENMNHVLQYYKHKNRKLQSEIEALKSIKHSISADQSVSVIRSHEGEARNKYYSTFTKIIQPDFAFAKREANPPGNEINALISFGNAMLYSSVLTGLYKTQLDPTISYVHEPSRRRYSLALDLSDVFKPLLVDRTIFTVLNQKQITQDDFRHDTGGCLLNENGRKTFIKEYENKLDSTIEHTTLNRVVKRQELLKLEGYKVMKHIQNDQPYNGFCADQCT